MTPAIRAQLESLGRNLTPDMIGGTQQLMKVMAKGMDADTTVVRDISYGPDERHRLDIFTQGNPKGAPVFIFVHGGGFVMGGKHTEGSPFYSNIGDFAARHGWVGVTLTYRLAPANRFPSGPEDMEAAVEWLRNNIGDYGGDANKMVMAGQSAGAAHVAGYLAHRREHAAGLAGAVLMSGIYDTTTCEPNSHAEAYYGEDRKAWAPASCVAGLLATAVPIQFSVAEFDPEDFQRQAAQIVGQWTDAKGEMPEMHYLSGHNHLTPALSIGSSSRETERMIKGFVRRVAG